MRTVETTATVTAGGLLTAQVPPDIPPGAHQVVVIDEGRVKKENRPPLDFPVISVGSWPSDLSLRREDMYGDDGR